MRQYSLYFSLVVLASFASSAFANKNLINSWRYWTAPDHTRLVFDVAASPEHKIFMLENPHRLVIDFINTGLKGSLTQPPKKHPLFSRVRSSVRDKQNLRVVVDLKKAVNPKSFALKPNSSYGHRLVVDLIEKRQKAVKSSSVKIASKEGVSNRPKATGSPKPPRKATSSGSKEFVVAIDAGHGGEDPGAHGPHGTEEKTVVLAIAKKLYALIRKHPGMKPVMVREGDYYVGLRKRMQIARAARADLFVSIHADAFNDSSVNGASVYTLSRRGASSEAARWLADHENGADLVGGVSLDDKDDILASVLLDLSQTATQDASREFADYVLQNFKGMGRVHKNTVQKAGFMVLKSPDIPSILVETAYISNPIEEQKLRSTRHQERIAKAIFYGIQAYYQRHAPVVTRMAGIKHVITYGDTLSGIASQYGVSMKKIQAVNGLPDQQVRVGQVLSIPTS